MKSNESEDPSNIAWWCSIVDYTFISKNSSEEAMFKITSVKRCNLICRHWHCILIIRLWRYPHTSIISFLSHSSHKNCSLAFDWKIFCQTSLPTLAKKIFFCQIKIIGTRILAKCDQRSWVNGYFFAKLRNIGKIPPTLIE